MSTADPYSYLCDLLQQARSRIEGFKAPDREMLLAIDRFIAGDGRSQDRPWRTPLPVAAAVFRTAGIHCTPFAPLVHKPGYGAVVVQASHVMVRVFLKHPTAYDPTATAASERAWLLIRQRPVRAVMAATAALGVAFVWWALAREQSPSKAASVPPIASPRQASSASPAPSMRPAGQDLPRTNSVPLVSGDRAARERRAFVEARLARAGHLATEAAVQDGVRRLESRTGSPRPVTGWMSGTQDGQAPLSVKCQSDTMIVLEDKYSGQVVATYFCRGGQTLETTVPLGTYRLKYGSGDVWYGPTLAFGPGTGGSSASYAEADSDLVFRVAGSYVEGHHIELIKQIRGNLSTDPISVSDF